MVPKPSPDCLFFVVSLTSGISVALLRRSRVIANPVPATHGGIGAIAFMLIRS